MIIIDIPDDIRERRREPTRENDQRRINMKRPNPIPKTRGPSWSSSISDMAIIILDQFLLALVIYALKSY